MMLGKALVPRSVWNLPAVFGLLLALLVCSGCGQATARQAALDRAPTVAQAAVEQNAELAEPLRHAEPAVAQPAPTPQPFLFAEKRPQPYRPRGPPGQTFLPMLPAPLILLLEVLMPSEWTVVERVVRDQEVVAWVAINPVGWRVGAVQAVGFRYYDPAVGRYISRDPIGYRDGGNVYAYVKNNPGNFIDPLGLSLLKKIKATVVGGARIIKNAVDDGVQLVNGRRPRNHAYAGKTYNFGSESKLARKYPDGVPFTKQGFPNFDRYVYKDPIKGRAEVKVKLTKGNRDADFSEADKAWGQPPEGYTWHHKEGVQDGEGIMQLVPTDLHNNVPHTGGFAQNLYMGMGAALGEIAASNSSRIRDAMNSGEYVPNGDAELAAVRDVASWFDPGVEDVIQWIRSDGPNPQRASTSEFIGASAHGRVSCLTAQPSLSSRQMAVSGRNTAPAFENRSNAADPQRIVNFLNSESSK